MNRQLIAVVAGTVAALIALALLLPTLDVLDTPFSAYGTGDADTSDLLGGLRTQGYDVASLTLGPTALDGVDPERSDAFYLAVGVDRGYTGPEIDALFQFVREGGTVIVLDDTGASGDLLDRLGLQRGSVLLSTTGNNPSVVPTQLGDDLVNLWEPVELIVTDEADVTVLANADNTTGKDLNENDRIDREEPTCAGGCPVAVRSDVGEGSFYVLADATFATNKYATSAGAIAAVNGIAQEEATGRRALVVVDESRHVAGPAEIGLTLFRLVGTPLGVTWVPYTAAGLVGAASIVSIVRRGQAGWTEHDPGLDEPYLAEAPEEEVDEA